jgi:hypothetical protein
MTEGTEEEKFETVCVEPSLKAAECCSISDRKSDVPQPRSLHLTLHFLPATTFVIIADLPYP